MDRDSGKRQSERDRDASRGGPNAWMKKPRKESAFGTDKKYHAYRAQQKQQKAALAAKKSS
jgi:hypothetical protein